MKDLQTIEQYFQRYAWKYQVINSQTIATSFFSDESMSFPLFVKINRPWVYFMITPFITADHIPDENKCRIFHYLLSINYKMNVIKIGIDPDGDVLLSAEVLESILTYDMFANILSAFTYYAPKYFSEILKLSQKH